MDFNLNNFDFAELDAEFRREQVNESLGEVEKQLEELRKESPQLFVYYMIGRMHGRSEIVLKLIDIVEHEGKAAHLFRKMVDD